MDKQQLLVVVSEILADRSVWEKQEGQQDTPHFFALCRSIRDRIGQEAIQHIAFGIALSHMRDWVKYYPRRKGAQRLIGATADMITNPDSGQSCVVSYEAQRLTSPLYDGEGSLCCRIIVNACNEAAYLSKNSNRLVIALCQIQDHEKAIILIRAILEGWARGRDQPKMFLQDNRLRTAI